MSGSSSVQLPLATVNTTPPPVTGQIIDVNSGGNLQAAINAAQPGDEIVLQAGAVFTGPITLPNFSGSGWITITSSGAGSLTPGAHVDPSDVSDMATILAPGSSGPALQTAPGAHNYYISGLNITAASSVTSMTSLVNLGDGSSAQNTVAEEPSNIILNQDYIHGSSTLSLQRGISLQSASTAIVNSYISDIHSSSQDAQAIAGWNGSGPYLIQNNFLEASGENVMFGGADPSIPNLIPSDITIEDNDFYKPLSWQSSGYQVKNLFELKLGDRVLVQNNTFENNWASAQDGYAILMRSTDQSGTAPWSDVSNVTFQQNVIENSANGINLASELGTAVAASNFNINNNLMYQIGGNLFQVLGDGLGHPLSNVSITNNTAIMTNPAVGDIISMDAGTNPESAAVTGFVFNNNVVTNGQYGVYGSDLGTGNAALATNAPGAQFTGNVIIGGSAGSYSSYPGNFFPGSVGFVDPSTGNYNLTNPSLYDNGDAGDQSINSTATAAPTVAITSAGGTTASSAQTITGTVDVADAGSTVTVLDGTTQIGTATVAANGAWSDNVTLANQGANVLTATDTNAGGTGTSNAVTYTLHSVAPTVAITSAGGTTTSSAQTITGTVDVADAASTVKVLDGTTQIGTATVAANGAWSDNVTLANQGANVLTATDTNAGGTGTSNAVTYTLHSGTGGSEASILWRNTNGDTYLWNSNGAGGFTYQDLGIVPTSWQIAGTGDFNGDGQSGILWRNTNGDTELWNSNGSGGFTAQDLGIVSNSWQIAGAGDFAGNGLSDILWRNTNGDTNLWNSNGSGGFTYQDLGIVPTSWQIAGTGDFNGDGQSGILWRNTNGDTELWNSNGSGGFTAQDLGIVSNSWQIAGTGDFTSDGLASILWRNTNGDTALWNPNGSGGFTGQDLGIVPNSWQIAGTGDFNGDGLSGILWRNTNGDTQLWNSNGSGGFTYHDLGTVSNSWQIAGTGDFK